MLYIENSYKVYPSFSADAWIIYILCVHIIDFLARIMYYIALLKTQNYFTHFCFHYPCMKQ